jgi:hypothetical protein
MESEVLWVAADLATALAMQSAAVPVEVLAAPLAVELVVALAM